MAMKKSKFTRQEINKIKQLRRQGYSGSQIAKIIHRRKKDVLAQIRKIEHKKKGKVTNPYGRKGKPKKVKEIVVYGIVRSVKDHDIYLLVEYSGYVDTNKNYEQIKEWIEENIPKDWITPVKSPYEIQIGVREVEVSKEKVVSEEQFIKDLINYIVISPKKKWEEKKKVKKNTKERDIFKKVYNKGWFE